MILLSPVKLDATASRSEDGLAGFWVGLMGRIGDVVPRMEPVYRALAVATALVLSGTFTFSSWHFAQEAAEQEARIRFEFRASQIADAIRGRVVDYEQVLRGGVGLFAASESVERAEWRAYVEHLHIEMIYPGIQGIGFVPLVSAEQKARHELSVRKEGFPTYAIQPSGDRPLYAPVMYIEPFRGRNLRAFGFDLYSEAERRAAVERARDRGEPAISGRVTLTQETGRDMQAGFIMFVPVFRRAMDTATVAERRAAILGYIYSPFRMDDLMRGILGRLDDVRLRILDDGPGEDDKILYSSSARAAIGNAAAFSVVTRVPIRGRNWLLEMESLPAFEEKVDRSAPLLVAGISGAISVLVLVIIWSLATLRARAVRLARSMTRDLRESRERLALALEGSNQALFDWDVMTGKVTLSDQWSDITGGGMEAQAITIADLERMVHPDDLAVVRERTRDLVRGWLPFYQVEHRVRTASGGWRWILSRAKVVERDSTGRALRVAGTNVDVTERKEIERLKAEFVATVSHELRTPLTALIGALGLLDHQVAGKLPPEAGPLLGMARQNSERLAALINNILDIEKIEAGHMEFRLDDIPVRALLERAVSLNAPYAEKFGVRFELAQVPDETVVSGDEDRLLQVLTNLMSNAVKYSTAGSAVTVSAAVRDGLVRVAVADQGPGVPEAFRERIFSKFAQADGSDTRRKGGTGLGLSISRAIVEKLGGTMGYDSVSGKGATFYFDLPLRQ
jgi:PAS domain S-box-containing protein